MPVQTVALTFDDGPDCGDDDSCTPGSTNTEKILDILRDRGVTATFFVNTNTTVTDFQNYGGPVASQVTKQNTLARIVNEGHLLASHSATHPNFNLLTAAQVEDELSSVENTLKAYTSNPIAVCSVASAFLYAQMHWPCCKHYVAQDCGPD